MSISSESLVFEVESESLVEVTARGNVLEWSTVL